MQRPGHSARIIARFQIGAAPHERAYTAASPGIPTGLH